MLNAKGGALTKWNAFLEVMMRHSLAYKRTASIDELAVHMANRGGLGLNAHNVHRNLAVIKEIGADRECLKKATAFEMSSGVRQERQLAFNQHLVQGSNGMLAELTKEERLLTVACSHFAAGCRAVKYGCKTPEASLQDANGRLNMQEVCQDNPVLRDIIEHGIEFTVVPAFCEELWPSVADLAQAALNAEHATISEASELQAMTSMAAYAEQFGGDTPWEQAMEVVKQSMPPCHAYLDALSEFARLYGGGSGAPMIRHSLINRISFYE